MAGMLKALIVDDEPVARGVLREELETLDDVRIVGEAENGADALEMIVDDRPDLVLLDLQMPVMGGLEVVRSLKGGSLPAIVIVTAWDQYAIQAFEAGAIDYLLKPVSRSGCSRRWSGRGARRAGRRPRRWRACRRLGLAGGGSGERPAGAQDRGADGNGIHSAEHGRGVCVSGGRGSGVDPDGEE